MKANTTPNVGANPSGGTGAPSANYGTADQFRFDTGGATIATASGPSVNTVFTATYIANISSVTEAGVYSTNVTYNIVANY